MARHLVDGQAAYASSMPSEAPTSTQAFGADKTSRRSLCHLGKFLSRLREVSGFSPATPPALFTADRLMEDPHSLAPDTSSRSPSQTVAIKVEDLSVLRPDFHQTTKAGGERQRLALACQTCRQKKVKCNGELPKCHRCTGLKLECEYKLTTHRRSRNPQAEKKRLDSKDRKKDSSEARQDRQEQNQSEAGQRQQGDSQLSALLRRDPNKPINPRKRPAEDLPTRPYSSTSTPIERQTPRRMATTVDRASTVTPVLLPAHHLSFHNGHTNGFSTTSPSWPSSTNNERLMSLIPDPSIRYQLPAPLPSHKLLIELCQIYFARIGGQMYSFLHPPSFMRCVVEKPLAINPALLLAISALSARFHTSNPPSEADVDCWASACLDMILGVKGNSEHNNMGNGSCDVLIDSRIHLSKPSLSCVQALSLISFHYFGQGRSSVAWLLSGFAVRMAHALHLNDEFYGDPLGDLPFGHPEGLHVSFRDREIRRRTFWALFTMDRLNSAGEHRPFTIRNEEVNIQLPVKQTLFEREIPARTASLQDRTNGVLVHHNAVNNMDCIAFLIRIIDIWGEVSCFVQQSADELNWADDNPLRTLRQKITSWADLLPPTMRFDLIQTRPTDPTWYIMHSAYFLSLYVLHRFALPKPSTKQYGIDHIPTAYLNMCVKEAIYNAKKVSEIVQSVPANVKISAPFMGFASFSAATLHAFLGYHVPDMDSETAALHRGYVASTLQFLSKLAVAWQPLSKMHDALSSQIRDRSRSNRSNRSSILHETSGFAEQFKVPDSMPTRFTAQQQIELNTLAFSNWFDDPMTRTFFDSTIMQTTGSVGVSTPQAIQSLDIGAARGAVYDSVTGMTIPLANPEVPQLSHSDSDPDRLINKPRQPDPSNAPYGEAFPIVNSDNSDDDAVVADLLVSFRQPNQPTTQVNGSAQKAPFGMHPGGLATQQFTYGQYMEGPLDQMGNLKESAGATATVDILQLMKVGLITSSNWS